jgi:hypothetical protein
VILFSHEFIRCENNVIETIIDLNSKEAAPACCPAPSERGGSVAGSRAASIRSAKNRINYFMYSALHTDLNA